jgi:hypothetical protein
MLECIEILWHGAFLPKTIKLNVGSLSGENSWVNKILFKNLDSFIHRHFEAFWLECEKKLALTCNLCACDLSSGKFPLAKYPIA